METQPSVTQATVTAAVSVVWSQPSSPRPVDAPMLEPQPRPRAWLSAMSDAQKLDLHDSNRVQTQVLLGESVQLIEELGDFARIAAAEQPSHKDARGYPGWVPRRHLAAMATMPADQQSAQVIANTTWLLDDTHRRRMELSFGTRLPMEDVRGEYVRVSAPGVSGWLERKQVHLEAAPRPASGNALVQSARQFQGLPYLWGGTSGFGFDCSGFVHLIHRSHGISIPRDASEQATTGTPVDPARAQPGDLLFFAYEAGQGRVHHVGINVEPNRMIHAPCTGRPVEFLDLANTIYERELCGARRFYSGS